MAASNDLSNLTMGVTGVSGPGTYPLGSVGVMGVTDVGSPSTHMWSSKGAGPSGSVTVTSMTDTRIQGTFTATLGPAPGTSTSGSVTITEGTFDLGRPHPS